MNVGLGDVGDAKLERGGEGEVLVDIPIGVDDERLLRLGTPDDMEEVRQMV